TSRRWASASKSPWRLTFHDEARRADCQTSGDGLRDRLASALLSRVSILHTAQRWLLFPSYLTPKGPTPELTPGDLELFDVATREGRTQAFLLRARGEGRLPAVIFAHGNAERAEQWIPTFEHV